MDINQLNVFISVAQTLNFSEAARRNFVSQSTVSRYISDLEKEFGVQLFTRSHRDVMLTNEGKTLLHYAMEMIETLGKAKQVIKQLHDGGKGKITIGCDVTSVYFPSKCISEFRKKYPNITVEIKQLIAADRSQAITGGEFDFCFMPRDMVPESSGIETLVTHSEPLVIAAPKDGAMKNRKAVSFNEIAGQRLVLLGESAAPILYMEIMDLLRTFHIAPAIESTYSDLVSVYMAVAAQMGVTIVPQSLAAFSADDKVLSVPIEDADTAVAYVMAWSKQISNPVANLFIETVREFSEGDDNVYGL